MEDVQMSEPRKCEPYYHVTFYDDDWDPVEGIGGQFLTSAEMAYHLAFWADIKRKMAQGDLFPGSGSALATGVCVEVQLG
jgi:hypothetical protein